MDIRESSLIVRNVVTFLDNATVIDVSPAPRGGAILLVKSALPTEQRTIAKQIAKPESAD